MFSNDVFGGGSMFNLMFGIFPIFFLLVFGIIIFQIFRGVKQWNHNNHSPVLTVDVKIVSKRTDVSVHRHNHGDNHMGHTSRSTTYYVTFQVESGDRIELQVPDNEYGLLVEGDVGKLTFQGTRFKGFQRSY